MVARTLALGLSVADAKYIRRLTYPSGLQTLEKLLIGYSSLAVLLRLLYTRRSSEIVGRLPSWIDEARLATRWRG